MKTEDYKEEDENNDLMESKYLIVEVVAEGTYGVVFKAREKKTGKYFAIKKFKNVANQGLPTSSIREIDSLKSIESHYLLKPIDVYVLSSSVHLVMEWKDFTLTKLITSPMPYDHKKIM